MQEKAFACNTLQKKKLSKFFMLLNVGFCPDTWCRCYQKATLLL